MNYQPPNKLLITSDNNILQLIKTIKQKDGNVYLYRFIKSVTKLNWECGFTEKELEKNLRNFFKVVE